MIRFLAFFILLILSQQSFAQDGLNLTQLVAKRKALQLERDQRINSYLKNARQPIAFTSGEGNYFLIVDIDAKGKPVFRSTLNANAAITTGAAKLQSGSNGLLLQGENLTLGVWDDGKIQNHIELGDRVISNEGLSFGEHATHVTGTLIASGFNPAAKGMAPKAKVIANYFDNDDAEIAALARPDQTTLLISNHSYGQVTGWYKQGGNWKWAGNPSISEDEDFNFGFYGDRAQAVDQIASLAPYYSIVWAAGNDRAETGNGIHPPDCNNGTGYDCIIPDAVAKNIITVGAVNEVLNYTNSGSVAMSSFSSWGPTDDGRIKPDLVGDGVNLFSLSAAGVNQYALNSGTSMATPNVAGSLTLLQELYSKLHGGNYMKAATLKAVAIHTTKEAGTFPGPDYSFGWGLLDVEAGANLLLHDDGINTQIRELTLNNTEQIDLTLSPQANQKIKATIVWTDPAGTPVGDKLDPTNSMLVNDLDIRLVDPDGNEILPWILDPGNPSKGATKGNNIRDNIEKIEFELPSAKPYHLIVSHKSKLLNGKQDFSLVISYQSTITTAQTYYWIGDTGDWSDASHWSYHSGDTAVSKIPSVNDNVIVDENSFDGVGVDQITFSKDQSVASLVWINSKQSGISLNSNGLTITKSLTIASPVFESYSAGEIILSSTSDGKLNFANSNLGLIDLMVNKGSWEWIGNTTVASLLLNEGSMTVKNSKISIGNLISNGSNLRALTMINSSVDLTEGSLMSNTNLTLNVSGSVLQATGALVTLDWNDVEWNGGLQVNQGHVILRGNNTINEIELSDRLEMTGLNVIDSLILNAGSEVMLASGSEQSINEIEITSTASSPIKISSDGNASVNFLNHKKFCFDFLEVTNVEAKGTGVINAGESAILSNAKGWNAQKCEDVLFADFEVKYPCEDGLTVFKDKSTGTVKQWNWTFPGIVNKAGSESDFSFQEKGKFPVTLTISNDNASQSYVAEIDITDNTLGANQILLNNDEMYSFSQADSYQWYRNEKALPSEMNRSYSGNGQDGVYFVVTYDDECNRISDQLTVTGLSDNGELLVKVYPNPSDHELIIDSKSSDISFVNVMDIFGRVLVTIKPNQKRAVIPVNHLNDGIYLIEITVANRKYRDKILIRH